MSPDLKAISSLTRIEICKIVSKYARMTEEEFQEARASKSTPKIHRCVLSLLDEADKSGDHTPLAWLLDRALGRIQDHGPVDEADEMERKLETMSEAELVELTKKTLAEIEAA